MGASDSRKTKMRKKIQKKLENERKLQENEENWMNFLIMPTWESEAGYGPVLQLTTPLRYKIGCKIKGWVPFNS